MAVYLPTYILWKVMVRKVKCFQGSQAEAPPKLPTQAVTANLLGKSRTCRMRRARGSGKCTVRADFFGARDDFCVPGTNFGEFWKFPLPRELDSACPLFCKGRDRLYQAPIALASDGSCATGREIRRDLDKNVRRVSICGVSPPPFFIAGPSFSYHPWLGAILFG